MADLLKEKDLTVDELTLQRQKLEENAISLNRQHDAMSREVAFLKGELEQSGVDAVQSEEYERMKNDCAIFKSRQDIAEAQV